MLIEKRSRLDQMIATINKTIQYEKGAIEMNEKSGLKGWIFRITHTKKKPGSAGEISA